MAFSSSSPRSFYSAVPDVDNSRPVSPSGPRYRPSKPMSAQLLEDCHIYFDEQLYSNVLTLLSDVVAAGSSHPDRLTRAVITPITLHIELVSSLLIHPRWTTQARADERGNLPARSITLLRNLLDILGPVNAKLADAFALTPSVPSRKNRSLRRGQARHMVREYGTSGSDDDTTDEIRGVIANQGRLKQCAQDFWHIVGWAFNCSVRYPKRWQYWKVWLDFMLDVLDKDYLEREKLEENVGSGLENPGTSLSSCLLVRYLSEVNGRSIAMKRIVRSVFSNGSFESLKEFPEVYRNETKEAKSENVLKRKRVDSIPQQTFGDYEDGLDDDDLESPDEDFSDEDEDGAPSISGLGGVESIALRQRIVGLLSRVSAYLPDHFAPVADLYDALYFSMKSLSAPSLSLFLTPSASSYLLEVVQVSLTQFLLMRLLSNDAPPPRKFTRSNSDAITEEVLESCFLPFGASSSSVEENAKASALIEIAFNLLVRRGSYPYSARLERAAEKGIKEREGSSNRIDKRKKINKKANGVDGHMVWLKSSSERLRCLVSLVKFQDS
ncbi:hypothetical protein BJ875DRAFT_158071 [Amylocarpus encephaloides]|uniref:Uncharacterized protein n=1 Tax=Amylocarpus encephaloides TaxID=45428 RepID=A0A9P7YCC1_9HELO|nr:hypothetical protein BJ875DRAFT_158071 [Amylocarpus encephaloides]